MKKKLYIDGMCCCKCPEHIREGLEKIEEIKAIEVDSINNTATIELSQNIDDQILKDAVKAAGHYSIIKIENM
ncbi:heavy metal-associated domain-containing protein [Wukongibacter baidiensis]|uniref:heavy-metal-associated domain-containing protein n=1 Tax=Wukongibacter baidiensis TaxID=1723361 RepID=UPI003D7FFCAE